MVRRVALAALLACAGCNKHVIVVDGQTIHEPIWREAESSVRYRAAADMHCPASSVLVRLVRRQGRYPVEVYAEGCGQQVLYTRALRRSKGRYSTANTEWVAQQ